MSSRRRSERQTGLSPEVWSYTQNQDIATEYDDEHEGFALFTLDEQLLAELTPPIGRGWNLERDGTPAPEEIESAPLVLDLGCGTGRVLPGLVARGYRSIGVDLSPHMLSEAARRLGEHGIGPPLVRLFQADMCDLDFLDPASVDLAACLFATYGLVQGRTHRVQCLRSIGRILKPGGELILHAHNKLRLLLQPSGWWLLWRSQQRARRDRKRLAAGKPPIGPNPAEFGDLYFSNYLGRVEKMYMRAFHPDELVEETRAAGFDVVEVRFVHNNRRQFLGKHRVLREVRADSMFVIARRPSTGSTRTTPTADFESEF